MVRTWRGSRVSSLSGLLIAFFLLNAASAQLLGGNASSNVDNNNNKGVAEEGVERYCKDCEGEFAERPNSFTHSPRDGELEDEEPHNNNTDSTTDGDLYEYDGWGSNRPHGVDVLVATFFLVAAGWLFMAIIYSVIILVVLRLQSRGELDIYDEDFGRIFCCNGGCSINLGCILRRYAIQLEQEQQRRAIASIQGGNNGGAAPPPERRVRIMTRVERRTAIETLLATPAEKVIQVEVNTTREQHQLDCSHSDDGQSVEEPVCSICLGEYEPTDQVLTSSTCAHRYHQECIISWLERRNNTECPCCRHPMVSDDEVWDAVRRIRKERRRQLRRENGLGHRLVKLLLGKRLSQIDDQEHDQDVGRQDTALSTDSLRSPSSSRGGSTDIEEGTVDEGSSSEDDERVIGTENDMNRVGSAETQSETSEDISDDDDGGQPEIIPSPSLDETVSETILDGELERGDSGDFNGSRP